MERNDTILIQKSPRGDTREDIEKQTRIIIFF